MKQIKGIKKAIQELWYDQKLVHTLKEAKITKEHLYNHLIRGRITLEEYVQAVK